VPKRKEAKEKGTTVEKPISALNPQPLPAEKCLNQFDYGEHTAKTTFLKGRPTHMAPMCSRRPWTTHRTDFGSTLKSLLPKNFLNQLLPQLERSSDGILPRHVSLYFRMMKYPQVLGG